MYVSRPADLVAGFNETRKKIVTKSNTIVTQDDTNIAWVIRCLRSKGWSRVYVASKILKKY